MQELVAFSQVIATLLVAATLYILWRQTCAMEANLEITQSQILDLQETRSRQQMYQVSASLADIRNDVERILSLKDKGYESWCKEDKDAALIVCSRFHLVGLLAAEKMIPVELFAKAWFYSIPNCHTILLPYLEDMRESRDSRYWSAFDFLQNEVVKHTKDFKGFAQTNS